MLDTDLTLRARSQSFDNLITKTTATTSSEVYHDIEQGYQHLIELLIETKTRGNLIYLIGNGGSAAVASHILTDFVNVCRLPTFTLHESSLVTCMSNDYGYENSYARVIKTIFKKGDVLIAISSSGKSKNICEAIKAALDLQGTVVTYTGFAEDNPVRKLGTLNFWLDSKDYGFVEVGHLFLLHNVVDRFAVMAKAQTQACKTGT